MKVGLARPCSLKKGCQKGGSLGPRCGPDGFGLSFGGTCEGRGPTAVIGLGGGKFGGPAGGAKDERTDATVGGRGGTGGTGGTFGGSVNIYLGIDPSVLVGTTPGCWNLVKLRDIGLLAAYRRPLFRSTNFEYIHLMLSGVWSYETFAELAIGAQIHDLIAREATDTRIERRYALRA